MFEPRRILVTLALLALGGVGATAMSCASESLPEDVGEARQAGSAQSVLTQHNDPGRSGAYTVETTLTPSLVSSTNFGLQYTRNVGAPISTQPLYASGVPACWTGNCGVTKNIVIVGTANNTLLAYDADDTSSNASYVWAVSQPTFGSAALAPTTYNAPYDPQSNTRCVSAGTMGIISTPVIDYNSSKLYVVTRDATTQNGQPAAAFTLHVIDIRYGTQLQSNTISASVLGGTVTFNPTIQFGRPGLLLESGNVVMGFGAASCDRRNFHGWVIAYSAADITQQTGVFCTSPNFSFDDTTQQGGPPGGGGVWQSGNGLVGDGAGNVYFAVGNGPNFNDSSPSGYTTSQGVAGYGDSFVKLHFVSGGFQASPQSYTPPDYKNLTNNDVDLDSAGMVLIGSNIAGGGKNGYVQVLDTAGFSSQQWFKAAINRWNPVLDPDLGELNGPHLHGTPIYWARTSGDSYYYAWAEKDWLRAFSIDNTTHLFKNVVAGSPGTVTPYGNGDITLGSSCWNTNHDDRPCYSKSMPGGFLSLSSNGDTNGVVWALVPEGDQPYVAGNDAPWTVYFKPLGSTTSRMYAFDALSLARLWSEPVPSAGRYELAKFVPPTIANGRVFRPTFNGILVVYGTVSGTGGTAPSTPFYGTIRIIDVNHDGYADVCGRDTQGIKCALSNKSNGFGTAQVWESDFTDGNGWDKPEDYLTIQYGDVNGDGFVDVCGRGRLGVYCALSNGTPTTLPTKFNAATLWQTDAGTAFSNGNNWNTTPADYATIRLVDVNGDGRPDICGRGSAGIWCGINTGSSFAAATLWQTDASTAFSNANGWNGSPSYYGTITFLDVNLDGKMDVCGRYTDGIRCAMGNGSSAFGPATSWQSTDPSSAYSDNNGWSMTNGLPYYQTIQFVDINGDNYPDVCARCGFGLGICCGLSNGVSGPATGFGATVKKSQGNDFTSSPNSFWDQSPSYYRTLQFIYTGWVGYALTLSVCGRGQSGIVCAPWSNGSFGAAYNAQPDATTAFSDNNGWNGSPSYYGTIGYGDVNGDGVIDVCGRGSAGINCGLGVSSGTFGTEGVWEHTFSDANGWNLGAGTH